MTEAWQGTHKGPGITLHGIVNMPLPNNPYEPTYWLEWFRPIDDGDAEIFREMISIKKREPAHG